MTWVKLIQGLMGLVSSLTSYLRDKQLIEAGEAKAILEGIQNANEQVKIARQARSAAVDKFNSDGMSVDEKDPNLRD